MKNTNFEQMGKAALIPGMQYMLDMMQKQLDDFRAQLNDTPKQNAMHPKELNHPEHALWVEKMRKNGKERWAKMTPAQKKAHLKAMQEGKKRKAA